MPTLYLTCAKVHTHLGCASYSSSRSASITHIHTSSCLLEIWLMMTRAFTPIPMPTLDCLHKYIFLLHANSSAFLTHMKLAYLFHQCMTSLLSRDGRVAGCTVRHLGVERPFSSLLNHKVKLYLLHGLRSLTRGVLQVL